MDGKSQLLSITVAQILAAALGFVGVRLRERNNRRDIERGYQDALSLIRDEIQVVEAWVKAYALVSPTTAQTQAMTARAQDDLERAYSALASARAARQDKRQAQTLRESARPRWALAVAATILFFPGGLLAIIFAYRAQKLAKAGDLSAARLNGRRCLVTSWASIGLLLFIVALLLV